MCPGPKRNQLETPGGAKSFLRGAQIFLTVSNSFKLYAAHFSREGENLSRGGLLPPCAPLVTGLDVPHAYLKNKMKVPTQLKNNLKSGIIK